MKMKYTNPEIEISLFATEAIICDSGTSSDNESENTALELQTGAPSENGFDFGMTT